MVYGIRLVKPSRLRHEYGKGRCVSVRDARFPSIVMTITTRAISFIVLQAIASTMPNREYILLNNYALIRMKRNEAK